MFDLLIRGGQVVTPHGVGHWDIAIAGEKIVPVGAADSRRGGRPDDRRQR